MYKDWYANISTPFRSKRATRALAIVDRGLVYLLAAAYIAALIVLAVRGDAHFWRTLLVPAASFILATVLRAGINAPRPYERDGIDPVIVKDTHGKSLPSRHVASACAIACAFLWLQPLWGVIAFIACAVVCFTRIVGGVHYPRDVIAALLLSLVCGLVGYVLVP